MKTQKHLFSLRDDVHYLNCASKAPLLKSAEEASIKALMRERNPVDIRQPDDYFDEAAEVRNLFAQLIAAEGSQIALIPCASYGLATALKNTEAKANGNAVTIKDEFPSGYFSLKRWCDHHSNSLIVVAPGEGESIGASWNQNILDQINEETSLVLMSSIHWMNGTRFDLEAIGTKCVKVGARFIVDGTQSVGAMPMDVQRYKIDALICASYKWLFGPYSLAVAYLGDYYNNGEPLEESWANRTNARQFSKLTTYEKEYMPQAGRYNTGEASNFILMPILKEGLKQILAWGPENIQQYCTELIKPLTSYLKGLNVQFDDEAYICSHLFSLRLPEGVDIEKFRENLSRNNVHISLRGEHLRVSVNVFNDEKDMERLMEVIGMTMRTQEESVRE